MQTNQAPGNWLIRIHRFFAHKRILYPAALSAAVLFLAITVTSQQYLPENAPGIIALQFCPTPAKFTEIIQLWGEDGLSGYRAAMWLDYLFPAAYGLFFASLISRLGYGRAELTPIILFPLAAGLFDWLENSIHLQITGNPDLVSAILVYFSYILSISKWLLLLATGVFILTQLYTRMRQGSIVDILIK